MRCTFPLGLKTSVCSAVVLLVGLICLTTATWAAEVDAKDKAPAQLMPASTAAYLEVSRPKDVIGLALDHPISKLIQQTPDFRKSLESPQFKQFLAVVGLIEARADVKWRPAVESITGGGIALGVDPTTQGAVLLIRSEDIKTRDAVRDALFSMVRDDAKSHGRPDPIESRNYRGLGTYKAGEVVIAEMGQYLLISNKSATATDVGDLFLDGGKTLADESVFADAGKLAAHSGNSARQAAWGFVRLDTLRKMGIARELLNPAKEDAKSDNPPAEILAGGLLSILRNSPYVAASLDLSDAAKSGGHVARISVASPNNPDWVPAAKQFYFAADGGGADEPLRPKGTVLSISTWRDLSALFQAAPDLFNEGVAGKFAQADSGLSNFLGGKSFSNDILGALEPQIQFVAARQDYKALGIAEPSIRLPAMALVLKVKEGQSKVIRRPVHLAFQTLLTFGNLAAASKNRPTLEARTETRGDAEILYSTYDTSDAADEKPAKDSNGKKDNMKSGDGNSMHSNPTDDILNNFSPALVLSSDHLMICSTRAIAEELTDMTQRKAGASAHRGASEPANTRIEADGSVVAALLRANREQLIAKNMLEKGHDRKAAEKEIDLLIGLVDCVEGANVHLDQTPKSVRLQLEIQTVDPHEAHRGQ